MKLLHVHLISSRVFYEHTVKAAIEIMEGSRREVRKSLENDSLDYEKKLALVDRYFEAGTLLSAIQIMEDGDFRDPIEKWFSEGQTNTDGEGDTITVLSAIIMRSDWSTGSDMTSTSYSHTAPSIMTTPSASSTKFADIYA